MSDLDDTLLCPIGMLERGDIVKYEKYGKEMEGIFIGSVPDSTDIRVRKTEDTTDNVNVSNLIEKTGHESELEA